MLESKLLKELRDYVELYLSSLTFAVFQEAKSEEKTILESIQDQTLEDFIKQNRKPSFTQILFRYIDKKGASDSEIYKKAGIDLKKKPINF